MFDTIKEFLGWFFSKAHFYPWLEHHLFYFFLIGVAVAITLSVIWYIKIDKDIKQMNKDKRKRDKTILKFLSDKKNKTY